MDWKVFLMIAAAGLLALLIDSYVGVSSWLSSVSL